MQALNALETGDSKLRWGCSRITDSGPILRLDDPSERLSKRELYGHPSERRIHQSTIPEEVFEQVVISFHQHGLRGLSAKSGGYTWEELHRLNKAIDWSEWEQSMSSVVCESDV